MCLYYLIKQGYIYIYIYIWLVIEYFEVTLKKKLARPDLLNSFKICYITLTIKCNIIHLSAHSYMVLSIAILF